MHDLSPLAAIRALFVDPTTHPAAPPSAQPLEPWGFAYTLPNKPAHLGTWARPSGSRVSVLTIARTLHIRSATIFRWQIAAIHAATRPPAPPPTPPPPPHLSPKEVYP